MSKTTAPKLKEPWKFEEPLCREVGVVMFFAADLDDPDEMDSNISNTQEAKKVCNSCVHKIECAEWAIHHEKYGIWGGLSPRELTLARNKRNITLKVIDLRNY